MMPPLLNNSTAGIIANDTAVSVASVDESYLFYFDMTKSIKDLRQYCHQNRTFTLRQSRRDYCRMLLNIFGRNLRFGLSHQN
jgi:hypothetical protein